MVSHRTGVIQVQVFICTWDIVVISFSVCSSLHFLFTFLHLVLPTHAFVHTSPPLLSSDLQLTGKSVYLEATVTNRNSLNQWRSRVCALLR